MAQTNVLDTMTSAVLISAPQSEHLPPEVLVLAELVKMMLMRMIVILLV